MYLTSYLFSGVTKLMLQSFLFTHDKLDNVAYKEKCHSG